MIPSWKVQVLYFENKTTRTALLDGKRAFGGVDGPSAAKKTASGGGELTIDFVQFLAKGAMLEIPPKSCSKGHKFVIRFEVAVSGTAYPFEATGDVTLVESELGEKDSVTLRFQSYDEAAWMRIQGLYTKRQSDVISLFRKLKGD